MDYQLLLLDYDGTLCDTKPAIVHSAVETCRYFGMDIPSPESMEQAISAGIRIIDAVSLLAVDQVPDPQQWLARYREIYHDEGDAQARLFPGVEETLHGLARHKLPMAILSNKGVEAVKRSLQRFGLEELMSLVIGDGTIAKLKPHRTPYDEIIAGHFPQITPENILMVGDTVLDVEFSHNCGIHACWAAYGYGNPSDIEPLKPRHTIASFREVEQVLGIA